MFAECMEMRCVRRCWTEMRDEQRIRPPGLDFPETPFPAFQIDVGWRRRRDDHPGSGSLDPGRIADKGETGLIIEVADVVRCVPRRIRNIESAASGFDPLPS